MIHVGRKGVYNYYDNIYIKGAPENDDCGSCNKVCLCVCVCVPFTYFFRMRLLVLVMGLLIQSTSRFLMLLIRITKMFLRSSPLMFFSKA